MTRTQPYASIVRHLPAGRVVDDPIGLLAAAVVELAVADARAGIPAARRWVSSAGALFWLSFVTDEPERLQSRFVAVVASSPATERRSNRRKRGGQKLPSTRP